MTEHTYYRPAQTPYQRWQRQRRRRSARMSILLALIAAALLIVSYCTGPSDDTLNKPSPAFQPFNGHDVPVVRQAKRG